jgi:hypothetical protein
MRVVFVGRVVGQDRLGAGQFKYLAQRGDKLRRGRADVRTRKSKLDDRRIAPDNRRRSLLGKAKTLEIAVGKAVVDPIARAPGAVRARHTREASTASPKALLDRVKRHELKVVRMRSHPEMRDARHGPGKVPTNRKKNVLCVNDAETLSHPAPARQCDSTTRCGPAIAPRRGFRYHGDALKIQKFTFGSGDRFAQEGVAQLQAVVDAQAAGIDVHPVWNKSNREHSIIGSRPDDLRAEADAAVAALGWTKPYYVDADHIGWKTVDAFLAASDFFTLDVADFVGKPAPAESAAAFADRMTPYLGGRHIPGLDEPLVITRDTVDAAAAKFLFAMQEAGRIARHVAERKAHFVAEVSVDETDSPQSPVELLLILAMIAAEGIPAQTIAPKFTGRFNKGVDYVGDVAQFEREFDADLAVLAFAVKEFGLPESLKLSVHSGSDKFALYPVINRLIRKHNAGLHVKTAGTTWLEEVIGLAEAGGDGLAIAKDIYLGAHPKAADMIAPYAPVVDIAIDRLPEPKEVARWSSGDFVARLRHDQSHPAYDSQFRQFLHVSFKVAAAMGARFTDALANHREIIARNVTENLRDRHIVPIFHDTF